MNQESKFQKTMREAAEKIARDTKREIAIDIAITIAAACFALCMLGPVVWWVARSISK